MKALHVFVATLAAMLLGACAGPGARTEIPLEMPNGEKATIVAHNQQVPDYMLDRSRLALNYIVKGAEVQPEELAAVMKTTEACRLYTKEVRPNNLVAVISQGVVYAVAGGVGVGIGAKAFAGAKSSEYAQYGAWAGGMSGAANGLVTLGGQTYTFENCAKEALALFPQYKVRILQKSPY